VMPVVDAFGEGKAMANQLEACNVIVGSTEIPKEVGEQGLRVGVQEITRYGMVEDDADDVAGCIVDGMAGREGVKARVAALADRFREVKFTVDDVND
jgi:glycine hydroxymethyltransferase